MKSTENTATSMLNMRSLTWSSLLLLLCFLWSATCQEYVNRKVCAILGSDATIKCTDVTLAGIRQITWQREVGGKTESFITYTTQTGPRSLTRLAARVNFLADGSIEIPNVTLDDEGIYKQVIIMLPNMVLECKIHLQVQVFPIIDVVPELDPVMVSCLEETPEETVGICIARAAKPPVEIRWRVGDLPYIAEESKTKHENGTVTTQSVLKMIPEWKINGLNVTCTVVQEYAMSDFQIEKTFTIRNIHFAPQMVNINILRNGDGSLQLLCHSKANPPAEYSWHSSDEVIKSETSSLIVPNAPAMYVCEAKNYLGVKTGSLKIENTFL